MRDNAEIVEPTFGLVCAVADDEVVAAHGLVAHEVAHFGIGMGRGFFAEQNGILRIADGHHAHAQIVVEIHINGLTNVARLDVGAAHVAVAQRAFDVNFVLVANEFIVFVVF